MLTVVNPPKGLAKLFEFRQKTLEDAGYGRRKVVYTTVSDCIVQDVNVPGLPVPVQKLSTHQGYWQKVLHELVKLQIPFETFDCRQNLLPAPKLHRLAKGLRFSQKDLLTRALRPRTSGKIGAPTRYGKTFLIAKTLEAYKGANTVLTLPGADLITQMTQELKVLLPDRDIVQIGGGSRAKTQSEDITVCSLDSLHKIDPGPVRLLLVDEPHAAVTESRIDGITQFTLALKIALGATLGNRFDGRDCLLEGIFGPTLAMRTFREAVAEGAICPIKVMMIPIPLPAHDGDRDMAMKKGVLLNPDLMSYMRYLSEKVIPQEWQTLFFISSEKQAVKLVEQLGVDTAIAMAKRLNKKDRAALITRIKANLIQRIACSSILAQGVTFHDVRVVVNCEGGGPYTKAIQKPGRLAEIRPHKSCGVLIDFKFFIPTEARRKTERGNAAIEREAQRRYDAYVEIGYDVEIVQPRHEKQMFEEALAADAAV